MPSPARGTTAQPKTVRHELRTTPFQPPRYSFGFADSSDAFQIAALDQYSLDEVRQSLILGNDEWIIARRGRDIVAAIRIRADERRLVHTADSPVVAAQHLHSGLERYLIHLGELWLQSLALPLSA